MIGTCPPLLLASVYMARKINQPLLKSEEAVRVMQLLVTTLELQSYVWSNRIQLQLMYCAPTVCMVVPDFRGQR